jgi:hypothetical protein
MRHTASPTASDSGGGADVTSTPHRDVGAGEDAVRRGGQPHPERDGVFGAGAQPDHRTPGVVEGAPRLIPNAGHHGDERPELPSGRPHRDRVELHGDAGDVAQQRVVQLPGETQALGEDRLGARPGGSRDPALPPCPEEPEGASTGRRAEREKGVGLGEGRRDHDVERGPAVFHTPSSLAAATSKR